MTTALNEARVTGMDCSACAATVRASVERLPGVEAVEVDFATGRLVWEGGDRTAILAAVRSAGYDVADPGAPRAMPRFWRERRLQHAAGGGALLLAALVARLADGPALWLELAALVVAAPQPLRGAVAAVRARRIDMNVLMVLAAVGAVPIGAAGEGATVLVLFALGTGLEALAQTRARDAVRRLLDDQPDVVTVVLRSGTAVIPVGDVPVGAVIEVAPGARVPIDGVVTDGASTLDTSSLTGESVPLDVAPGAAVLAGSLNGGGRLRLRTTCVAADSTLAELVRLTERAQANRGTTERTVDRFARVYTPAVVAVATVTAIAPPLVADGDWATWLYRALALVIVACPCALVISTPVAVVSALAGAARHGALIKDGAALERLATIRCVAFDKTGTLTTGRPAVVGVRATAQIGADDLLALAARVARSSSHPISRAIAAASEGGDGADDVTEIPGLGLRGTIDGDVVLVGNQALLAGEGAASDGAEALLASADQAGATPVLVSRAGRLLGVVLVADPVRADAAAAVGALLSAVDHVAVLSGDRQPAVDRAAQAVGITDARGGLLPADKLTAIEALRAVHGPIAMVGDGTNDAPALAAADAGIAMRGATDVALDTADAALLSDRLARAAWLLRHARRSRATVRQNIAASIATKVVLVALAPLGYVPLWLAVAGDMGLSLIVTAWSLRLLGAGVGRTPIDTIGA